MSIKAKGVIAAIWVANFSFIRATLSFIITIILSLFLTPQDFGVIALAELVIINLEIIRNLGIDQELIYRQKQIQKAADTGFSLTTLSGLVFCLIVYFSASPIGKFFNNTDLTPILQALAPILALSGLGVIPGTLLEKELRFKERFIIEGIAFIAYSLITIILVFWGIGIWSIVYGKISQSLIQTSLLWIVAGWCPHSLGDFRIAFEILNYGRYITAMSILSLSFQYIDNIAIGKFSGTEALGLYVLAYSLANLPAKFTSVLINRVSFPIYSQLQEDKDKLSQVFLRVIQIVTLFSIPVSVGILVLAPRLILTLYSAKWTGSIAALQILSFYGLARSVGSLSNNILYALGKKELMVNITLAIVGVSALLLYPVVVNFGIIGVSLLVTTIIVISSLGLIHLALRYLDKSWQALFSLIQIQIFGTLFMSLIILPLSNFFPFTLFYLILLGLIGLGVYAGSILFLTRGKIISDGLELIEEIGIHNLFLDFLLKQFALVSSSVHKKRS